MNRPWYLTGWLVLIFIFTIFALLGSMFGGDVLSGQYPNLPAWIMPVFTIGGIVDLVAIVMLWMWKKMGFYLIVGETAVTTIISFLYLDPFQAILQIVGIVILYLVMKPVWSNFK